jgi:hypothetical protein
MAKPRKASVVRTPPVPSDSHAVIAEWMRHLNPDMRPIVEHLDRLIRRTIPGLQYAVKWRQPFYGLPDQGWVIGIAAYIVSANVEFYAGATFATPPPEGVGRSRYVKVKTLEEAKAPALRNWIEQAARVHGWK